MRRAACVALAMVWQAAAAAAPVLPAGLTGYWSTDDALFATAGRQVELLVQEDGLGLLVGSQAARRMDGVDDGKRPPRAVAGLPFHAAFEGETLTLRPFLPGAKEAQAAAMARMVVTCRFDAAGMTLACGSGPAGEVDVMRRRGTAPPEALKMLDDLRTQR